MTELFDVNLIATFFLLVGLELVLGIDNILMISIVTGRLPAEQRERARLLGLTLAVGARGLFLLGASHLTKLTDPVFWNISVKDLVLISGGLFLLYKAVKEIHHVVEAHHGDAQPKASSTFSSAITQILLLDVVFSIDSVITAVGLTDSLFVIFTSVIISFLLVLAFAGQVSSFVEKNPSMKILALSFLLCIGITLFIEGLHAHVPKAYIYLPMGFALGVELLQMRYDKNRKRK